MRSNSPIKKYSGNNEIFWDLWIKHKKTIFNACRIYTGSHYHDTQDLMSEVMFKAYNKTKNQQTKIKDPQNWFMRIVQNAHINRYNYNSRFTYFGNMEEVIESRMHFSRSPYKEMLGREMEKQVFLSLQKLPPYQGHLARLYFEGHSYNEISENFSVTPDNIRKIVQISRQSVKQDIRNYKSSQPCTEQSDEPRLYGHIIKTKKAENSHYSYFYSSIAPHRLEQKTQGLKKYLSKYPHAGEKRLHLAETLASNSEIDKALNELNHLLMENFYNENLYDLKIRLLIILGNYKEVFATATEAIDKLPLPSSKFNIWKLQAQMRYKDAEDFLKLQVRQEPTNILYRALLVDSYQSREKCKDAYDECRDIETFDQYHIKSFPTYLLGKLKYESPKSATNYVENYLKKHSKSIIASIYLLHLYLGEGLNLDNEKVNKLFHKIRKRYFWHPDFALSKAFLSISNKEKGLQRRCSDYPDCALSKHYLNKFSSGKCSLPELNAQEKRHLEILILIYGVQQ